MSGKKMTGFNFNAAGVAPKALTQLIDWGWYKGVITDGEVKAIAGGPGRGNGAGQRMTLTFKIIEGDLVGRELTDGINFQHSNEMTQKIAQELLSSICHATGVINPSDVSQFFNRPFMMRIGPEKEKKKKAGEAESGFEQKSEFKNAKPCEAVAGQSPLPGGFVPNPAAAFPGQAFPGAAPAGFPGGAPAGFPGQPGMPPGFPNVAAAPAPVTFPPAGWFEMPGYPGYYNQPHAPADFKTADQLHAMFPAPAAPVAAPPAFVAPVVPAGPVWPPEGWQVHPQAPAGSGWYLHAQTGQSADENTLRAQYPAPVAAAAPFVPQPVAPAPAVPGFPQPGQSFPGGVPSAAPAPGFAPAPMGLPAGFPSSAPAGFPGVPAVPGAPGGFPAAGTPEGPPSWFPGGQPPGQ